MSDEFFWTYTRKDSRGTLRNAILTEGSIFGTWFCLQRSDGQIVWEQKDHTAAPADTLVAVTEKVIVATKYVARGFTIGYEDVFRFHRNTGLPMIERLGLYRRWGEHFFDGDSPRSVRGEHIITYSGRILEAETGMMIGRVSGDVPPPSVNRLVFCKPVTIPNIGILKREYCKENYGGAHGKLILAMYDPQNEESPLWKFDAKPSDEQPENSHFFLEFVLDAERPFIAAILVGKEYGNVASRLYLIDLQSGVFREIWKKRGFGDFQPDSFCLEDADADGILISWCSSNDVNYHLGYLPLGK